VHVAVYLLINLLIVSSAVESAFTAREGMQAVVLGKLCNTEDEKGPSHTCNFDHHGLFPNFALRCVHLFIQNKFHANRVLNFASSTTQNAHKSSCWIPDFQLFRMKLGHCWKYGELYWHQRIYMADAEILSCIG